MPYRHYFEDLNYDSQNTDISVLILKAKFNIQI